MLTRLQLVVLGVVVLHGASCSAMEKKPVSPRIEDKEQVIVLRCSAELRKQAEEFKRTNAISVPSAGTYYRYPGNSPVDYVPYPYHNSELENMRLSDCP